jgi:hypothetical protein
MNSTTLILIGVAIVLGLLLLLGGGTPSPTTETSPTPPGEGVSTIPSGGPLRVDVGEDLTVGEREAVRLVGTVEGAAAGTVRYQWTAQGGLGYFNDSTVKEPIFTAPSACDCEDCVLLTLTVTDARGITASDSLVLTVRDPLVCPSDPCPPAPICVSVDPCAPPIAEICPARPDVPCETPCITEVPPFDPCSEVVTPCPCVDGDCDSAWISTWPFAPPAGRAVDRPKPQIVRHFPSHIPEGSSFVLSGTISNPACASACFVWAVSKGWLEDPDTLTPTYHAPMSDRPKGEPVTISLIVYDGFEGRSYDQVRLTIDNVDYDGPRVP